MILFKQMQIDLRDNIINFRYIGSDTIIHQTQLNQFIEDSGLTILNPGTNLPVYGLELKEWGTSLLCGHIIDNINGRLLEAGLDNIVLIIDFNGVTEVSQNFCEQYFNFLLTTPSKIININMNTSINNAFVSYINSVVEYQEM